jgi:hypothetical protein
VGTWMAGTTARMSARRARRISAIKPPLPREARAMRVNQSRSGPAGTRDSVHVLVPPTFRCSSMIASHCSTVGIHGVSSVQQ